MKTVFNLFSLLSFLLIALISLLNISNTITIENSFLSIRANVGFLILFCAMLSSIATLLFSMASRRDKNKLKNQIETTKLNYEIESDKVKQLEAKISTLEQALKIATKK